MRSKRIGNLESSLDKLYLHWRETRRETIAGLGDKEAVKIIDFHAKFSAATICGS